MKCDRLLTWQCYGQHYVDRLFRKLDKHPLGSAIRAGQFEAVVYTRDAIPTMPHVTAHPGPQQALSASPAIAAKYAKMATPLVFPDAKTSIVIDADLAWHDALVDCLGWIFDAADRFGFVCAGHPFGTWTGEPLTPAQRAEYLTDTGMIYLQPCYMSIVVARRHASAISRNLTAAWLAEFDPANDTGRDQPALARAVWKSGLAPLASPMTLVSWPAAATRPHGHIPLFRHDPHGTD